jgi:Tol biopolymer transport system component
VNSAGGKPSVVVEPDTGAAQGEFRWPHALPDGRRFLFFVNSENREKSGTYLGTLGSRKTTQLLGSGAAAMFAPPGHLLYVQEGLVLAQRFDVTQAQLRGEPMTVLSDVADNTTLSATVGGLLALTEVTTRGRLLWLDRGGRQLGAMDVPKPLQSMELSPDNTQLLGSSNEGGNFVVWLIDLERNVSTQMATDGAFPAWAPDGSRFAYSSVRAGEGDVFVKSVAGKSEDVPWLKTNEVKVVSDWSADGRFIVFTNNNRRNVWLLPTFGDRKPFPFVDGPDRTRNGRVSPGGRLLAYVSDETGKNEVYVQSFPTPGAKRQVSTGGGGQPVWRKDGLELFYLSSAHDVMSVSIRPSDGAPGPPRALFAAPEPTTQFAVSKDGQRFLVMAQDPASDKQSITLLTNWEAAQTP